MKLKILIIELGIKNLDELKQEFVFEFAEVIYVNSILDAFDSIIEKDINTIVFSDYRGHKHSLSYLKIFKTINPLIKVIVLSNEKILEKVKEAEFLRLGADFIISAYDIKQIKDKINKNLLKILDDYELNDNWRKCTKQVIKFLKKNYNKLENNNIDEISLHTGYSGSTICHYVKEDTNKTIGEWIQELRIKGSIHLMSNSNFSIKFISSQVGYKSVQGFIKAFKNIIGKTPTEFKKNNNF